MKLSNKEKLTNRLQALLDESPNIVVEYSHYFLSSSGQLTETFYKKLLLIKQFLLFYIEYNKLGITYQELKTNHLEELPIETIQDYIKIGYVKDLSAGSKKNIIQTLSAFWTYFTKDSYDIKKRKPIFYRHAFNEWKVAYSSTYKNLLSLQQEKVEKKTIEAYSEDDFRRFLEQFANIYPLLLTTEIQRENWRKNEDKYLATAAILLGAGITLREFVDLNINSIDLRKKSITIVKGNIQRIVPILEFAIPYIKPYLKWRRSWYAVSKTEPALFVNLNRKRVSRGFPSEVVKKMSLACGKAITPSKIRISHGIILLKDLDDIAKVKDIKGLKKLTAMERYIQK